MSNYLNLEDLAVELDELRVDTGVEAPLDEEQFAKLDELKAIEDQLGDLHVYAKNNDSTLIPEDEFEEHVQEMAEEKYEFLEVEYDGNTYLIRG